MMSKGKKQVRSPVRALEEISKENVELRERVEMQSRVIRFASRDITKATSVAQAAFNLTEAAEELIVAGFDLEAGRCLRMVRDLRFVFMRDRVSNETGGINHKPEPPQRTTHPTPATKGKGE